MLQSELNWLEYVAKGHMDGFDCMFSGDRHRKGIADGLVERGLLVGLRAVVCDSEHSPKFQRETERDGYAMTVKGDEALAAEASKRLRGVG